MRPWKAAPSVRSVTTATPDGLEAGARTLKSRALAVTLIPGAGGKIRSFYDRVREREWLWAHPTLALETPRIHDSYIACFDTGGIDECFPGVTPGEMPGHPGLRVPDHGEWWSLPWETRLVSDSEAEMVARGVRFPVEIRRNVKLLEGSAVLRLSYTLLSHGTAPLPTVYCIHPLFAIEPGMRLEIDPGFAPTVSGGEPPAGIRPGDAFEWPTLGPLDLSRLDARAGSAVKVWGEAPPAGRVVLSHPGSRSRLVVRWDPAELPHLGLWINQGGWAGVPGAAPYANLGIEPGWGGVDGLDEAVERTKTARWLEPGDLHRWTIEVAIEEAP